MAFARIGFLTFIALVISSLALSARAEGTATGGGQVNILEMEATERTSHGVLDACELRFVIGFEDYIYRNGEVSVLRGAISLHGGVRTKKVPSIFLKVTAFDILGKETVFAPLDFAFVTISGQSYGGKQYTKFACEDGGICMAFNLMKYPQMMAWSEGFEIGITRSGGNSDVVVPVEIADMGSKNHMRILGCQGKIIKAITNDLE